jgi:hypothetical protein
MRLSEHLIHTLHADTARHTAALYHAAPRIRAAESLEDWLRDVGVDAQAHGRLGQNFCAVQVIAQGKESLITDTLCRHNVTFDRSIIKGEPGAHYDCNIGTYTVRLIVLPAAMPSEIAA